MDSFVERPPEDNQGGGLEGRVKPGCSQPGFFEGKILRGTSIAGFVAAVFYVEKAACKEGAEDTADAVGEVAEACLDFCQVVCGFEERGERGQDHLPDGVLFLG